MRLDGVRVLDLSRLLPGPYATQLLGDMGADVIKVEEPDRGDYARSMDDGTGVFQAVNRGKRSVALDLSTDDGRDAFLRLAADADVVLEGFRPGVTDRLGVGYEDVREANEGVVYCSLTGFGASGPNRDRVGHDLNYVGMAGFLDMNRQGPESPPIVPGYPIADMAGGLFAAFAVVSALLSRELGDGIGEHVDVAMTDVVASFSQVLAGDALTGGDPRPVETPLTGSLPCYDVYEAADGRYVTFAALEPAFFQAFCEAVDRPDLANWHVSADPETRGKLRAELADVFRSRTRAAWEEVLGGADASVAPVRTPAEALDSQQARERGLIDDSGPAPRVGVPAIFSDGLPGSSATVPGLGEHTRSVLQAAGFDDEEIQRVRDLDDE